MKINERQRESTRTNENKRESNKTKTRIKENHSLLFEKNCQDGDLTINRKDGEFPGMYGGEAYIYPFIDNIIMPDPVNRGNIVYRWYEWFSSGVVALNDGGRISGAGTTTLTISNIKTPGDDGRKFYLTADHDPTSAVGIGFSTGNAVNEPDPKLSFNLAAAISSGDLFEENEKHPLPEIDPRELILGLNWIPSDKFSLQAMFSISGKSEDNLEEVCLNNDCWPRVQTSGYSLLDLFASYIHSENLEFRVAVENITDKKYLRWASVSELPENDSELDLYGQNGRSISASFKYIFK